MTSMAALVGERIVETARFTWRAPLFARFRGGLTATVGGALLLAFATYNPTDPSWNTVSDHAPTNLLGGFGATFADLSLQSLGLAAWAGAILMVVFGLWRAADADPDLSRTGMRLKALACIAGVLMLAAVLAAPAPPKAWPLARGLGGFWGSGVLDLLAGFLNFLHAPAAVPIAASVWGLLALGALGWGLGVRPSEFRALGPWLADLVRRKPAAEIGRAHV